MRIPRAIPKRFHKYIVDCDAEGVDDGCVFLSIRGLAFADAGIDSLACHSKADTPRELAARLKDAAPCTCSYCNGLEE